MTTQNKNGAIAAHSYILLDRTGSMSSIWEEALGSVNAYAKELSTPTPEDPDPTGDITLAVFDAQGDLKFDVLRRAIPVQNWSDVTTDEASPRGMTPLFDAVGRMVSLAEQDAPERAVIIIMTDGHENASREFDRKAAEKALDRCRARGWEVIFLGANFADFDDAIAMGMAASKSMAMAPGSMGFSMSRLAKKSRTYYASSQSVDFDEEDRQVSGEDKLRK